TESVAEVGPLPPIDAGAVACAVEPSNRARADVFDAPGLIWAAPTDLVALLSPPTCTTPPDFEASLPPGLPTVAVVPPTASPTDVSVTAEAGSAVTCPTWTTPTESVAVFPPESGLGGTGTCACAAAAARTKLTATSTKSFALLNLFISCPSFAPLSMPLGSTCPRITDGEAQCGENHSDEGALSLPGDCFRQ